MIDGFTILVAQLAAVVLLAALSGGLLGWLIGRRRRALAAAGGNGAIVLDSPTVAQMNTSESGQWATEPPAANSWAGDPGQVYQDDSRDQSTSGDEELPRVTITAPYELEEPWTAGMTAPEKNTGPSNAEFDQVLITRPEMDSASTGTDGYDTQNHSTDPIDHSYFRPPVEQIESRSVGEPPAAGAVPKEDTAVQPDRYPSAAGNDSSDIDQMISEQRSESAAEPDQDHQATTGGAAAGVPLDGFAESAFSAEPALEQTLVTDPSLAFGSDINQPVSTPTTDASDEDQVADEGITSVQDPVQLSASDASTKNLPEQTPDQDIEQDQPTAAPVAAEEQDVLDSDSPVTAEPEAEKTATTPPVTTGAAIAVDITKNTAQVELDMWNHVAEIPTQPVDQPVTDKEGDQSVSVDAAVTSAGGGDEDQSSRIAELERLLAKREHELSRLEAGATAAWDTTVPTLEQLIEKLRDENSALQSALGQASVVVESMQTELQILRKTRDSQARQQ